MKRKTIDLLVLFLGIGIVLFSVFEGYAKNTDFMQAIISNRTGMKRWELIGSVGSFPIGFAIIRLMKKVTVKSVKIVVILMLSIFVFIFINSAIIEYF